MKKLLAGLMALLAAGMVAFTPSVRAADAGGAGLLSAVMPGAGEWYNNGWKGAFPWGECIVGHICFLVHFSSIVDAVNGNTDSGIRVDFWSAPK